MENFDIFNSELGRTKLISEKTKKKPAKLGAQAPLAAFYRSAHICREVPSALMDILFLVKIIPALLMEEEKLNMEN